MSGPLKPSVRLTLVLDDETYRFSNEPLADAGAFAEGRVISFGAIERSCSWDNDYDIATCDVVVADDDGLFRGLLNDPNTRHMTSREASIELLSQQRRAAGFDDWRDLFRGRITDVQAVLGRRAKLRIADAIGSHFSGFDLDKTIPQAVIRRLEHPNAPDEMNGRVYPIIVGNHTDVGLLDEHGDPADKGLLPVFDVGDYVLSEEGEEPEETTAVYLTPPANLDATVNGTAGSMTRLYAVTAISPYGETTPALVTVTNAPDLLNGTDSITLTWDAVSGAVEYRVYGRGPSGPRLLIRLNNGETWTNPETTWTDTGTLTPGGAQPPETNTAQTDQVIEGSGVFGWARLIVGIGRVDIEHVYASDLASGTAPKRVRMEEDVYGVEFLVPGRPGWPYPEPIITINGIEFTAILARGERLSHHRTRTVTITVNACGARDENGKVYDEAFPTLQWFLNEHVLKNDGEGYRSGEYGPLVEYTNGVPILQTSQYAACQEKTVGYIGGRGYLCAWALVQPISLREFLRRFQTTFDCLLAANHHGQIFPVLIDTDADPEAGRIYRDTIEIRKATSLELKHDAVETRVIYHYDWDTEASRFRVTDQVYEDTDATELHKGVRQRGARSCYYTRDATTAHDSNQRHIARFRVAPRLFGFETDLTGLEDENGAQIRVTHYELDDTGEPTPFLVLKHRVDPNAPERVVLTGFDLGRIRIEEPEEE